MSNNVNEIESKKTIKLPYELPTIDFTDWLLYSRRLEYSIVHKGFDEDDNEIEVKNLEYKNKIYAFKYDNTSYDYDEHIHLPMCIVENEIISYYTFAVMHERYKKLLSDIFKNAAKNMGSNNKDAAYKAIIDFVNDVISSGILCKDSGHIIYRYFNPYHPFKLCDDAKALKAKLDKDYKWGDLVKITNIDTGKTYFGTLTMSGHEGAEGIEKYNGYLIDDEQPESRKYCYKYFLPWNTNFHKVKWVFDRAQVSELNETQKRIYEERIKHK